MGPPNFYKAATRYADAQTDTPKLNKDDTRISKRSLQISTRLIQALR